jgi:hypothetical protein
MFGRKLNQILILTSFSPFLTSSILKNQRDPLVSNFLQQFKQNKQLLKVTDLSPQEVEIKKEFSKISRKENKAIVELVICDSEKCSKINFTAKRPHFIWFYEDVVVDSTFCNSFNLF